MVVVAADGRIQTVLLLPRIGHTVLVSIETSRTYNRWIHVPAAYIVLRIDDFPGFVDNALYQSPSEFPKLCVRVRNQQQTVRGLYFF